MSNSFSEMSLEHKSTAESDFSTDSFSEMWEDPERYKLISEELHDKQYCVIDNFFQEDVVNQFREEILAKKEEFQQSKFVGNELEEQKHIFDLDMSTIPGQELMQGTFAEKLNNEVGLKIAKALSKQKWLNVDKDVPPSVKLQRNAGGAFPWHYDSTGGNRRRRVTFILYLNPYWEQEHGGEIVLMPFGQEAEKIQPLMNRCVIFLSEYVQHRVLPAKKQKSCPYKERLAVTMWFESKPARIHYGTEKVPARWRKTETQEKDVNPKKVKAQIEQKSIKGDLEALYMYKWSRHDQQRIARAVYSELYLSSIKDAVGKKNFKSSPITKAHNDAVKRSQDTWIVGELRRLTADSRRRAEEDL